MPIVAQPNTESPAETPSDQDMQDKALEDLFAAHCQKKDALSRGEFHLIVLAWNRGKSMDYIGAQTNQSRTPVRAALHRADALGLLTRCLLYTSRCV